MRRNENLSTMIKVALLGAIAAILMYAKFPLPFAPGFMDIDIAEVPGLIAGLFLGPLWGVGVVVLKLILKFITQSSSTFGIGELSNLIISSTFILTSSLLYRRNKTFKNAIFSITIGVITMSIVAIISNYFIVFPAFGIPMEGFAQTMSKMNPLVSDVPTFILFSILPFNLIKGGLNLIVFSLLYKPLSPVLKKRF